MSKHRNHLLKAPFCVHPSTGTSHSSSQCFETTSAYAEIRSGRVCIPVNPSLVDDFDPETVPTVGELLNELDRMPADDGEEKARRTEGMAIATGRADR